VLSNGCKWRCSVRLIVLGVLFVVFALVPGLKQGRRSPSKVGVPATGTQRAIMFLVGAVAAYEGLKTVVLCNVYTSPFESITRLLPFATVGRGSGPDDGGPPRPRTALTL
jgi:hypothetical protein